MSETRKRSTRLMRLARISAFTERPGDGAHLPADLTWLAQAGAKSLEPLIPLVVDGAKRQGVWRVLNADCRRLLEARRFRHVAAAAHQRAILAKQVARLERAGISIILLKGSAFMGYLYDPQAPRGAGDVDFLVRTRDFKRACDILASQQYPMSFMRRRKISTLVTYQRDFVVYDQGSAVFEIHRAIMHPFIFPIDESALFRSSVPHPALESAAVRVLSPEDNLIHLGLHGFQHLSLTNHGLFDAHEMVCQKKPSWPKAISRAKTRHASRSLYFLLKAATSALDTPVPDEVLSELRPPPWCEHLADAVYRVSADRALRPGHPAFRFLQLFGQLAIPDSRWRVFGFQSAYALLRLLDYMDARARADRYEQRRS